MIKLMGPHIDRQLKFWEMQKSAGKSDRGIEGSEGEKPFVCISREYGCGGFEIASELAGMLNREYSTGPGWAVYDRKILEKLSEDMGFSSKLMETLTVNTKGRMNDFLQQLMSDIPSKYDIYRRQSEIVRVLASKGNVILVGRGATYITRDMKGGLCIKITAPYKFRIDRISGLFDVSRDEAKRIIKEKEELRRSIFKEALGYDIMDPYSYDMLINSSRYTVEESARIILSAMMIKNLVDDKTMPEGGREYQALKA